MKKIGKILLTIVLIPYVATVIFLTACLLNYNDYNVTEFGNYSLVIIGKYEVDGYRKGDLVIVEKTPNSEINIDDNVFFYNKTSKEKLISYAKVENKEVVNDEETTYTLEGNYKLSSSYVMGKENKVYQSVGGVLSALESRWGFLFFVIFPVLLIFIYQIYRLIIEIKTSKNHE